MKRLLSLAILALAPMSANAALLASWNFSESNGTTSSAGTVGALGGTAGSFTNYGTRPGSTTSSNPDITSNGTPSFGINGAVVSGKWNTGSIYNPVDSEVGETVVSQADQTKGNTFSFTASKFVLIQSLTLNLALVSKPTFGDAAFAMYYSTDGGTTKSLLGTASTASTSGQTLTFNPNLALAVGSTVTYYMSYTGSGLSSSGLPRNLQIALDDVTLNGTDAIPEPASFAIFGALGLGLAARRFRKK